MIEGKYETVAAIMTDPASTTQDLIDFGGNAEDAVRRCNDDKQSVRTILTGEK